MVTAKVALTQRQLIAHLLRRAGFGATPAELDAAMVAGYDATVDRLVNYESVDNSQLEADLAAKSYDLSRLDGCQSWWLFRMLRTARPLEEKMTLFWHGHFACNNTTVGRAPYMIVQNKLFRDNALGAFDALVLKVSQDPAMLIFLDGRDNGKRRPNENYARELMELFTLGIGNYTENDVKEAARALTGWTIKDDRFFNNLPNHDITNKTFLGQTGNWDGTDICRIVCQQPACATFIARKLIRFFVSDSPTAAYVARIGDIFRSSGLDVRAAVAAILRSPEFVAEPNVRATVKSPVEFLVGSMKALEVSVLPPDFPNVLKVMQQELFNPPGVDGWKGGPAWLSTTTFLQRANFINRLASGNDPSRVPFIDPSATVASRGLTTSPQVVDDFVDRLLDGEMSAAGRQILVNWLATGTSRNRARRLRGLIHLILTTSTHQLN